MKVKRIGGTARRQGAFDDLSADASSVDEYSFTAKVIEQLTRIGITEPPRPKFTEDMHKVYPGLGEDQYFDGRMPTTVKKLTLDQMSDLYVLFDAWYEYLMYQFSLWKTKKSEASARTKLMEARLRKEAEEDGMNDQQQRTYARMDVRFVEEDANLEYCKAMFDYVECQVKITSKNMSLLSREITIREMKLNVKGKFRGHNRAAQRYAQHAEEMGVEVENEGDAPEPTSAAPARARGRGKGVRRVDHRSKSKN